MTTSRRPAPRRPAALAAVAATVLLLHLLLLGLGPAGFGGAGRDGVRPVLQTRAIVLPPAGVPAAAPVPAAEVLPAPARAPARAQAVAPAPAPAPASAPLAEAPALPASVPVAVAEAAPEAAAASPEPAASAPTGPTGPQATGGGEAVPVYATVLPPAARLVYELRRGLLGGSGVLQWSPGPEGYTMTLEGTAFALPLLSWTSRGEVDAHGLAPLRFTDRRRGRAEQAANFRRDVGRITYSGPTVEHALPPGAQDRLSWMVQLGAILAADPALRVPGRRVLLFVSGARGDADLWAFDVIGVQDLELPAGPVAGAVHLLRAPRKPFDTQAEAWLDPARGFLPVRARLATPDSGDATDLLLAPTP